MGSSINATMGFGSNTYVKAAGGWVVNLDMSVFRFVCALSHKVKMDIMMLNP
jgi:hypothetical protein